jgi:hypothetical protein
MKCVYVFLFHGSLQHFLFSCRSFLNKVLQKCPEKEGLPKMEILCPVLAQVLLARFFFSKK